MTSFAGSSPRPGSAFREPPRPARLLLHLTVWVVVTVVVSGLAATAVDGAIEAMAPGRFPFVRVVRRVAMFVALVSLALLARRAGVRRAADLGLRPFDRIAALRSLAVGLVLFGSFAAIELASGQRRWLPGLHLGGVFEAVAAALAIGLVEQVVFHGLWLFPYGRLRGAGFALACTLTSALYATAHFARGDGRVAGVAWWSGFAVWAGVPAAVARYSEAWFGLAAAAALLYAVAWRAGNAWPAIGLHAGSVLAIKLASVFSRPIAHGASWFFVDGLLPGWRPALIFLVLLPWVIARGPFRPFGARLERVESS